VIAVPWVADARLAVRGQCQLRRSAKVRAARQERDMSRVAPPRNHRKSGPFVGSRLSRVVPTD